MEVVVNGKCPVDVSGDSCGCPQPEALKVRLVTEARQTFGTKAAAELWLSLNLPIVAAMRLKPAQADLFVALEPLSDIQQQPVL